MGRIGSILSGAERRILNQLREVNAATAVATFRLAKEQKVNSPSDNPSAFLALSLFQSRLNTMSATMANVTAASSRVTQAQTILGQIRTQLNTIRTELVKDEAHTLTPDQRAASQATIDTAIKQIDTLAGTKIDGQKMLDGSGDFQVSGRNAAQVRELRVYTTPGTVASRGPQTISGRVTQGATQASLTYTGAAGKTTDAATFTLSGDLGSEDFSVADHEALTAVAQKINDASHKTGVTASVNGNDLTIQSVDYGSDVKIGVAVSSGTFAVTGGHGDGTANGANALAEINGRWYGSEDAATVTARGNTFTVNDNGFRFTLDVAPGFTGTFSTMSVVRDPMVFELSTDVGHQAQLAIPSLLSTQLGSTSGTLDQLATGGTVSGLNQNTSRAIRIVDEALGKLDLVDGTVNGFYTSTIATSSSLLSDLQTDLQNSIKKTDGFNKDEENGLLSHYQELSSNAVASLSILNQQRTAMVDLIKQIAGLT